MNNAPDQLPGTRDTGPSAPAHSRARPRAVAGQNSGPCLARSPRYSFYIKAGNLDSYVKYDFLRVGHRFRSSKALASSGEGSQWPRRGVRMLAFHCRVV